MSGKVSILIGDGMSEAGVAAKIKAALRDEDGVVVRILEDPHQADDPSVMRFLSNVEARQWIIAHLATEDEIIRTMLADDSLKKVTIQSPLYDFGPEDFPVPDVGFLKKAEVVDPADKRPGHLKGEGARITKMRRR